MNGQKIIEALKNYPKKEISDDEVSLLADGVIERQSPKVIQERIEYWQGKNPGRNIDEMKEAEILWLLDLPLIHRFLILRFYKTLSDALKDYKNTLSLNEILEKLQEEEAFIYHEI